MRISARHLLDVIIQIRVWYVRIESMDVSQSRRQVERQDNVYIHTSKNPGWVIYDPPGCMGVTSEAGNSSPGTVPAIGAPIRG